MMRKFVMVEEVVVMDDEKVCYGGGRRRLVRLGRRGKRKKLIFL
jgi:hypothetical protein